MFSRFWMRLGRFALLLLSPMCWAYVAVVTIILRQELDILDAGRAISAFSSAEGSSTVKDRSATSSVTPSPSGSLS